MEFNTFEDGRNLLISPPNKLCRLRLPVSIKVGSNLNRSSNGTRCLRLMGVGVFASEEFDAVLDVVIERRHSMRVRELRERRYIECTQSVPQHRSAAQSHFSPSSSKKNGSCPKAVEKVPPIRRNR